MYLGTIDEIPGKHGVLFVPASDAECIDALNESEVVCTSVYALQASSHEELVYLFCSAAAALRKPLYSLRSTQYSALLSHSISGVQLLLEGLDNYCWRRLSMGVSILRSQTHRRWRSIHRACDIFEDIGMKLLRPLTEEGIYRWDVNVSRSDSWIGSRPFLADRVDRILCDHTGFLEKNALDEIINRLVRIRNVFGGIGAPKGSRRWFEGSRYHFSLGKYDFYKGHFNRAQLHCHRSLELFLRGLCYQSGLRSAELNGESLLDLERELTSSQQVTKDPARYQLIRNINRARNHSCLTHGEYSLDAAACKQTFETTKIIARKMMGHPFFMEGEKASLPPLSISENQLFALDPGASSYVDRVI